MYSTPPVRTAKPSAFVSLSEAKKHLRVDHPEEDDLINLYIEAAIDHLDGWGGVLGRAVITQTWEESFSCFENSTRLSVAPLTSVTSVTYVDSAGATQTLSTSVYEIIQDAVGAVLVLKPDQSFPALGKSNLPVKVTYVCGVALEQVPAAIKSAVLLMVGDLYQNRETTSLSKIGQIPMSMTVQRLIAPYRKGLV
jgi:uncharacterized phiE125 gp8 family phage protein